MGPKTYRKAAKTYPQSKSKEPRTIRDTPATYLLIVESPSKCAKIESYLGTQYQCIASKGHIRQLDGLKSIDTKNGFTPKFQCIEEKKDHIQYMKRVIAQYSQENIYIATDDDREGEAIAHHICEVFELPVETTKRILFHEITQTAIQNAIKAPKTIDIGLVKAQQARQILDILVGFKISPLLWKYIYHSKSNSLSAGRCQTPALRLIYEKEQECKNARVESSYRTTAYLFSKNIPFLLNHAFQDGDQVRAFLEISKTFPHILSLDEKTNSEKSAPTPFNTSRLLQSASSHLHYSPKQTMQYAQQLYQEGYITYMRTESTKYSEEFLEKAKKHVVQEYGETYLGKIEGLMNKDSQNPHEAIRVTNIQIKTLDHLSKTPVETLYRFIWKHTVESCMSTAKYHHYKIRLSAPNEQEYQHILEMPVFLGWKKVTTDPEEITEIQNTNQGLILQIQSLSKQKQSIPYQYIEANVVANHTRNHYTEASLIQKLEDLGIGRPSTYSMLVETIQERGYVLRKNIDGFELECEEFKLRGSVLENHKIKRVFGNEKNKLVIQPMGILCIEFLVQHFPELFSYDYTKKMEEELDKIVANYNGPWYSVCEECNEEIKRLTKTILNISKKHYEIDDTHDLVFQPQGPVIRKHKKEEMEEDGNLKTEIEYLPVKKQIQIDLDKLKRGEYTLEELVEWDQSYLGEYEGKPMYLKSGKFGEYVEWGDTRKNIQKLTTPRNEITVQTIDAFIKEDEPDTNPQELNRTVLRHLNDDYSVRRGKFGMYVYYKPKDQKKPEFYNMKKFKKDLLVSEPSEIIQWIRETYSK
jgi:DNA topoisomerase-1